MPTLIFNHNNYSIPYTDTGKGTIVVLLHGFAETGNIWKNQVPYLKSHYRVIVPEIPDTSWGSVGVPLAGTLGIPNRQNAGYPQEAPLQQSIDTMADAAAALIKSLTNEPIILLGHSMGGYITLAVAEKYPMLLKAWGLIHSTAFADTDEKKENRKKGIQFIQKHGVEAFLKTSAPGLLSERSKQQHPEWIAEMIKEGSGFAPALLTANYEAMMARPERTNVLRGSKMPVLFIIGKEDKAASPDDLLQQVHLPEVSYFHVLENVAHMGMWEAADRVNCFIQKFIEDCG